MQNHRTELNEMKINRYYKVAGHSFAICLREGSKLWESLGQYSGFETDAAGAADPLFTLELMGGPTSGEPLPQLSQLHTEYDSPTEDGETVIKLFTSADKELTLVEMAVDHRCPICAKLLCDKQFKHGRLYLCTNSLSSAVFAVNNSAMLLYAFTTTSLDTLEMHSSVVVNDGKAFLFLGHSGTGKSTHSSLWLKHISGSELMNDDNPIVRVLPNGKVVAYGSPWSGKTPCYKNIEAPVGAFVQIKQYPQNEIRRMPLLEAYATLYSSSSGYKADEAMADGLHSTMEKVVTGIPFYELACRPDEQAAILCHSTVCK